MTESSSSTLLTYLLVVGTFFTKYERSLTMSLWFRADIYTDAETSTDKEYIFPESARVSLDIIDLRLLGMSQRVVK